MRPTLLRDRIESIAPLASGADAGAGSVGAALPLIHVLAGHVVFTLLNALLFANTAWLIPLLVRLRFGSAHPDWKDWQTTLVTAAVPAVMMSSILWNELLRRMALRHYLLLFWLTAAVPLGCLALVQNYWQLFLCHVIATLGSASWTPVNGKLLERFYAVEIRGRVYALLNIVTHGGGIVTVYLVGRWLERNPDAFRLYFPLAAIVQLAGVALLVRLARRAGASDPVDVRWPLSWSGLLRPVLRMGAVLRSDRTFRRYEQAFMTYGAAFMLCDALLPVLATDRLHMRYEDYAHSTQMISKIALLAVVLPAGWTLDRLGAMRTSGIAFGVLAMYPLLLLTARDWSGVATASAVMGVGMGWVSMGWMLGPVALAGTGERVPHYVAIHATLVGVRGIVFQGAGMLLYKLTGGFAWPLLIAAAAFTWAAFQMWRLHGDRPPIALEAQT